jgi:hypothetical protein
LFSFFISFFLICDVLILIMEIICIGGAADGGKCFFVGNDWKGKRNQ